MSINIFTVPQIKTHRFNWKVGSYCREAWNTYKMRSAELVSFAEATCCNQHQRRVCIPSATSVKNKQEMQADYHARTKAEWTSLKERKQNDSKDAAPLKRAMTTDEESSLEDAIPSTTWRLQKASVHHQNTVQPLQGAKEEHANEWWPHAQLWGVSENWFRRLHPPVSNLLTIFDRLSGWLGQTTPSSSQPFFISVSCFYLCCLSGKVDAIFNNCSYKKYKCWSLDAFFVFKCQWL